MGRWPEGLEYYRRLLVGSELYNGVIVQIRGIVVVGAEGGSTLVSCG